MFSGELQQLIPATLFTPYYIRDDKWRYVCEQQRPKYIHYKIGPFSRTAESHPHLEQLYHAAENDRTTGHSPHKHGTPGLHRPAGTASGKTHIESHRETETAEHKKVPYLIKSEERYILRLRQWLRRQSQIQDRTHNKRRKNPRRNMPEILIHLQNDSRLPTVSRTWLFVARKTRDTLSGASKQLIPTILL